MQLPVIPTKRYQFHVAFGILLLGLTLTLGTAHWFIALGFAVSGFYNLWYGLTLWQKSEEGEKSEKKQNDPN